jgi:ABC-2 type transport system permease protein
MFKNNLVLLGLMLRRDRISIALWFVGLVGLVIAFGAGIGNMYPTDVERVIMVQTLENPVMVAMMGPVYTLVDGSVSVGMLYSIMMLLWMGMITGIMNIFTVVRHTRKDEELGRIEVIRSLPVGKQANLSAVLTLVFFTNLIIGLVMGLGLGSLGQEGMDMTGSMVFGLSIAVTGIVFGSITALLCQLTNNPRTAQALSFGVLIVFYMVRAVGDMQGDMVISSLSPLGLILRTQAYHLNNWWPILVVLGISIGVSIIAIILNGARDLGEGLFAARPGRADAHHSLKTPTALAWRLLRTSVIIWATVIFFLAAAYGSVMGEVESFIASNELFEQISGGDPMMLISFFILIACVMGTIPVLQFILKAYYQERRGFGEGVFARAVSHREQLKGYFLIALITSLLVPFVTAVGFFAASYSVMDEPIPFVRFLEACMIYTPAILFMLGLAVLVIGYLPRATTFVWAYLGYAFGAIYLGSLLQLPDWIKRLTPYGFVPMIPAAEITSKVIIELVIIFVLAIGMMILGFISYGRRDMKLQV